MSKKRTIILAITIAVTAALLIASFFVAVNSGHECVGKDCVRCALLINLRKIFESVSFVLGALSRPIFLLTGTVIVGLTAVYARSTPVSRKVKLSD
ncbi:MAG: hypothetical protein PUC29_06030 [Clostridia bacterium]|nr:hypothetical protein [Clostridia bacterium]